MAIHPSTLVSARLCPCSQIVAMSACCSLSCFLRALDGSQFSSSLFLLDVAMSGAMTLRVRWHPYVAFHSCWRKSGCWSQSSPCRWLEIWVKARCRFPRYASSSSFWVPLRGRCFLWWLDYDRFVLKSDLLAEGLGFQDLHSRRGCYAEAILNRPMNNFLRQSRTRLPLVQAPKRCFKPSLRSHGPLPRRDPWWRRVSLYLWRVASWGE